MEQSPLDRLMRMGSEAGEYVNFCTALGEWSKQPGAGAGIANFEPHHVELLFGKVGALLAPKALSCTVQKVQKLVELGFSAHTLVKSLLHLYRNPDAKQLKSLLALLNQMLPYCTDENRLRALAERATSHGAHADVVHALECRADALFRNDAGPDILDSDGEEEAENLSDSESLDAREGLQDRSNKPLPDDEGASEDPDSGEDEPREEASGKFVQNPPEEKAASNKDRKKHNNIEKKSKKKARNTYQVEAIIAERPQYKVRWLGYAPSADTWEVEEHIRETDAFARYKAAKERSAFKEKKDEPRIDSDSEDGSSVTGEEAEDSDGDGSANKKKQMGKSSSSELESEDEEELDRLAPKLAKSAKKRKRSPAAKAEVLPEVTLKNVIEGKRARPEAGQFAKIEKELAKHS